MPVAEKVLDIPVTICEAPPVIIPVQETIYLEKESEEQNYSELLIDCKICSRLDFFNFKNRDLKIEEL